MTRALRWWVASSLLFSTASAYAVDAVYVDYAGIEAQGFGGRLIIAPYRASAVGGYTRYGATSDGNTVYALDRLSYPSASQIVRYNPTTGQSLGTTSVPLTLDDIAITNGQLYGIVSRSDALQIVQIQPNGATSVVFTKPGLANSGSWRLSGSVAGSQLLALRSPSSPSFPGSFPVTLIDPATLATSQFTINASSNPSLDSATVIDTVIKANASSFTALPAKWMRFEPRNEQPQFRLPNGAALPSRTLSENYASDVVGLPVKGIVSDEFSYAFGPANNAVITTSITGDKAGWGRLYRRPVLWTGAATATLTNGVAPDGTTLVDVQAPSPFRITGPVPLQATITPANPGPFAARTLGSGTFSLDLRTAPRGVYDVDTRANLTATYVHDGISETGRSLDFLSWSSRQFAYDPVSPNLVGNGDFELSYLGWERSYSSSPDFWSSPAIASDGPTGNHAAWFTPSSNSHMIMRQFLELGTPNAPMRLSFDYRLDPFGGQATLDLLLNGISISSLTLNSPSESYTHFETLLTDPALMGLTNPEFRVKITAGTQFAWVDLDNLSLIAVPEPASLSLCIGLAAALACRRSRRTLIWSTPILPRTIAHEPSIA